MSLPYQTEAYAATLGHIGAPLFVPEWGCHVLVRDIPDTNGKIVGRDAIGCYPLGCLKPDADLTGGLLRLRLEGLVSVTLVIADRNRPAISTLMSAFAVVTPYKTHYLWLPQKSWTGFSKHHRYEIRRALASVRTGPLDIGTGAGAIAALYGHLESRHQLQEIHRFPATHFTALARIGGFTAFGGWVGDELVCAHIWAHDETDVVSHVGASSPEGYRHRAAYAVYAASLEHFSAATCINLGGGVGNSDIPGDGLVRFKAGFANGDAPAYLCGAILDTAVYARLSAGIVGAFFPAYRRLNDPKTAHYWDMKV
jgi:hypothetical protein